MKNRVALVTGASRGIGEAVARALSADGYRVALCARSTHTLARLADELSALAVTMDVGDPQSIEAGVSLARSTLGPIDVLVANAGIARSAPIVKTLDEDWEATLNVNLTGCFRLSRACVPDMIASGWGRVIFVSSNAGLTGYKYTGAYCASKHGVIGLMRTLALEVAARGITANAICPGFVDTDMATAAATRISATTQRSEQEAKAALASMSPQNRLIQVDEIVAMTRLLVSDGGRGINGQALTIDGGQVLH
ncbi:MAG: SDR family oxidoreductase [Myxococcales bacterium]|nr:SDR family oxidoreductase [Myxococcales bacterium]